MFKMIRAGLGKFVVKRKFEKNEIPVNNFTNFFKESVRFVVVVPDSTSDFEFYYDIVHYLEINKKSVTIICSEILVNRLRENFKGKIIDFNDEDKSKLYIPTLEFREKLLEFDYDVLIDLTHKYDLFKRAIGSIVKAQFKIGFSSAKNSKRYNLVIQSNEINSEISYRILLNSLQMF